jgi:hypothetical protein
MAVHSKDHRPGADVFTNKPGGMILVANEAIPVVSKPEGGAPPQFW